MAFEFGFLRSKVTRRVVWLFFLSALVPITLFALLSFTYVTDVLLQQTHNQLRHTGKLYGTSVLERLIFIDDKLRNAALIMRAGQLQDSDELNQHLGTELNTLSLVSENSKIDMLFVEADLPDNISTYLSDSSSNNESYIYSETTPEGVTKVYIRLIVTAKNKTSSSLVAEINNTYLWGDSEKLPYSTKICVTEHTDKILFCSHPAPSQFLEPVDALTVNSTSDILNWSYNNEPYLAGVWVLDFNSRFKGPQWKIIASQREADALLSIRTFNIIFPLVIVLSLLATLVFSISLIRRSMVPLEKLIEGTQRVANKVFNKPVKVDSHDEFETLANSFNAMTSRVEKQIKALTILSEIDQLILTTPKIETLLFTILERIPKIVTCKYICITLTDKADHEAGWAYINHVGRQLKHKPEKTIFSANDKERLLAGEDSYLVDLSSESWKFLESHKNRGVNKAQLFPIILEGRLIAVVCLGFRSKSLLTTEDIIYVHDLAERLAVAFATVDRDEKLYRQAHFDILTNLPNRQLLHDRLDRHIVHAHRTNQVIGILYIDLDRFKNINDSLGHDVGDKLLQQTAERLNKCVREADTVARLSGDEFVVLLPDISDPKDASIVAEHIINRISEPFNINTHVIFVTPSIGITLYPIDGNSTAELLKQSDTAMYRAKQTGRGKYQFYEERMNLEDMERSKIEQDMRHALTRNEFELVYQPQINLESGKTIGVEALIRWNHPTHGTILPTRFISLAEDTGMIEPIGEWVLRTACRQYKIWQENNIIVDRMSVNVSSRQFMQGKFAETVYKALSATGMAPERLELEITESLLMEDRIDVLYILDELHSMGVNLVIDDFGTGYSSLSYLKRLPVDALKIDKSFIRDVPEHEDATTITNSIIALAHALKINVIAEGIETEQQLDILRSQKCDSGQGFYTAQPMTADDFINFVTKQDKSE